MDYVDQRQGQLEEFTPQNITPSQIAELVLAQLTVLSLKYDAATRRATDLLFYVNLNDRYMQHEAVLQLAALEPLAADQRPQHGQPEQGLRIDILHRCGRRCERAEFWPVSKC